MKSVKHFIDEHQLKDQKVLVGCSGGSDSIALARVLIEHGIHVEIAHCNYQLRNEESEEDQRFVEAFCSQFSLPFHTKRFSVDRNSGKSTQEIARDQRFEYFQQIITQESLDLIAVGTNADDNIETFFINLMRGTGLTGLTGIDAKRDNIIRPLLTTDSRQILDYLAELGQPYRSDSSNDSDKYLRNKIRHQLLPLMEDIRLGSTAKVTEAMAHLKESHLLIESQTAQLKHKYLDTNGNIQLQELKNEANASIILFSFLQPLGFNGDQVRDILKAIDQSGKTFYSSSHILVIDRGMGLLTDNVQTDHQPTTISVENESISGSCSLTLNIVNLDDFTLDRSTELGQFDFDKLQFPLTLRKWKTGDKMKPLGMRNQKKISDILIDRKVSVIDKANTFVLESGGEICWLINHQISETFKIDSSTKKVYIANCGDNNI